MILSRLANDEDRIGSDDNAAGTGGPDFPPASAVVTAPTGAVFRKGGRLRDRSLAGVEALPRLGGDEAGNQGVRRSSATAVGTR